MNKLKSDWVKHNKRVAKIRGDSWRAALRRAKFDKSSKPGILKKARFKKGYSQEDIVSKITIGNKTTYSRIESGASRVNKERAEKISKLLGLKLSIGFKDIGNGKWRAL